MTILFIFLVSTVVIQNCSVTYTLQNIFFFSAHERRSWDDMRIVKEERIFVFG